MLKRVTNKNLAAGLLLCSLFVMSLGAINVNGSVPYFLTQSTIYITGAPENSAMSGAASNWRNGYNAAVNTVSEYTFYTLPQFRGYGTKTGAHILLAVIAALMAGLIYWAKYSEQNKIKFDASRIIYFLHKKDGMK